MSDLASSLTRMAAILLLLAAIGLLTTYLFQRKLQYFPDSSPVPLPPDAEALGLSQVDLTTSDGVTVLAWFAPPRDHGLDHGQEATDTSTAPGPARGRPLVVVVFHGNGGHRGTRLENLRWLVAQGHGALVLDYRGYGGSEGQPSEPGLYADAEAAIGWLTARGFRDLVYFGESLGSGVAIEMATRHPPRGLILEAPFDSALAVGKLAYPFLPVGLMMKDTFRSDLAIDRVHAPLLVIHGTADEVIPIERGRRLFALANEPKRFVAIPGAGHNDLELFGERYHEPIARFLAAAAHPGAPASDVGPESSLLKSVHGPQP